MHVLLTGGAGFVGSHACRRLLAAGHSVTVVDNLATGRAEAVPAGARLVVEDIASLDLMGLARDLRPDAVVHLAAQISVSHSVADPLADARTNIQGTINVLEAARASGARRIVFASSAAVYGMPDQLPVTEETPVAPISPYGLSKATAESYIRTLGARYGIAHAILRFANVYGPGQTPEGEAGVVAIFCDKVLKGVAPTIFGDGLQTRDFVYVGDVAEAILLALESNRPALTAHVSTATEVSVNQLWALCRQAAERLASPERASQIRTLEPVYGPERPGDIRFSALDNRRIAEMLGWRPQVALAEGLMRTLQSALAEREVQVK